MTPTDAKRTAAGPRLVFEAPGPGEWMLDTTHHGRRPVTGYMRQMATDAFGAMEDMLAKYGAPIAGFDVADVHGLDYIRARAVGDSGKSTKMPPMLVLRLVARLHPELRRRNRAAAEAWRTKLWREDVDNWFDRDRRPTIDANLAFQRVDIAALPDSELVDHVAGVTDHLREQARLGFTTHGGDIVPVGDLLAHCQEWGISYTDASALLAGSSPESTRTATMLEPVARALASTTNHATSVEALRGLSSEVAAAVDEFLEHNGWRLICSDDLDSTTLAENPTLQLKVIATAAAPPVHAVDPAPVRDRVPADRCADFDVLLAEARYGIRLRDDNVGIRWNWPSGLLRRALLEVGRRLVDTGRAHDPEDALELEPSELGPLLLHGRGPGADALAARRQRRFEVEAADPPVLLGDPAPPPPFDVFPAPLARAAKAIFATISAMAGEPSTAPLHGTGIGDRAYRGVARVIGGADQDIGSIEPGEVLVAPFTGPSYNSVLPLLGALVVEEGGPMCHAAIVSREFGLPAVIGAAEAMTLIATGDLVEVDPIGGVVRVLTT